MVEKRSLRKGESVAGIASGSELDTGEAAEDVAVTESATFTSEELREFLEADTAGELADPEFKERLRQKLWDMVRRRVEGLPPEEE